jgi:hypothetical protein
MFVYRGWSMLFHFSRWQKSTLLTKLTGTHSEAADYEFTTLTCSEWSVRHAVPPSVWCWLDARVLIIPGASCSLSVPGSIQYKGCKIQLLDLPGIIEGAKDGKGRGRQVIGVARTCNLILIVLDAGKPMIHKRYVGTPGANRARGQLVYTCHRWPSPLSSCTPPQHHREGVGRFRYPSEPNAA